MVLAGGCSSLEDIIGKSAQRVLLWRLTKDLTRLNRRGDLRLRHRKPTQHESIARQSLTEPTRGGTSGTCNNEEPVAVRKLGQLAMPNLWGLHGRINGP